VLLLALVGVCRARLRVEVKNLLERAAILVDACGPAHLYQLHNPECEPRKVAKAF